MKKSFFYSLIILMVLSFSSVAGAAAGEGTGELTNGGYAEPVPTGWNASACGLVVVAPNVEEEVYFTSYVGQDPFATLTLDITAQPSALLGTLSAEFYPEGFDPNTWSLAKICAHLNGGSSEFDYFTAISAIAQAAGLNSGSGTEPFRIRVYDVELNPVYGGTPGVVTEFDNPYVTFYPAPGGRTAGTGVSITVGDETRDY